MNSVQIARKIADMYIGFGYYVSNVTRNRLNGGYMFYVDDRSMTGGKGNDPVLVYVFDKTHQVRFEPFSVSGKSFASDLERLLQEFVS